MLCLQKVEGQQFFVEKFGRPDKNYDIFLELATLDFFNALKLSEKSNQITLHHLKALI
jgi:hypothetical protein